MEQELEEEARLGMEEHYNSLQVHTLVRGRGRGRDRGRGMEEHYNSLQEEAPYPYP